MNTNCDAKKGALREVLMKLNAKSPQKLIGKGYYVTYVTTVQGFKSIVVVNSSLEEAKEAGLLANE